MPEEGSASDKKKIGGLSPVTWGVIGIGSIATYYLWTRYRSAQNANALSGGTTIPQPTTSGTTTTGPQTLAEWFQAAISAMTTVKYGPSAALNDLNAWLNGNCVSSDGYSAIGNIISTIGLPPGYNGVTPTLSICSNGNTGGGSSTNTPPAATSSGITNDTSIIPALPASYSAMMTNNGERIVADAYDAATKTYLYLTDLGGVYTLDQNGNPGGVFYGSYLGLPAQDRQTAPGVTRYFNNIIVNGDGTYTLVAANTPNPANGQPETYTFAPGTPQNA